MASAFIPIEHYSSKLYQRCREAKKFSELDAEDLAKLAKSIYWRDNDDTDKVSYSLKNMDGLIRYRNALEFLTNPTIHMTLRTFDERIAYLIMMADPELVIYKEFLKTNIISLNEIEQTEDKKKKKELTRERDKAISEYVSKVRSKIGFYDPKLLKYEKEYFSKYFSTRELITEVENNDYERLLLGSKLLKSFDNITDERFEELEEIAKSCISLTDGNYSVNAAAYNVLNQKQMLGIKGITEQLALFILLVDSDLDMLRIFEEESRMDVVEERIREQFGCYNLQFLTLEKLFHKRFCPNKKLSAWEM